MGKTKTNNENPNNRLKQTLIKDWKSTNTDTHENESSDEYERNPVVKRVESADYIAFK